MARTGPPRVFLDANVIYSAIHSPQGVPAALLLRHVRGGIRIVVSQQVLSEVIRTVRRKLPGRLGELRALLSTLGLEVVRNPAPPEIESSAAGINHSDAPIVAAAVTCGADFFVTGDQQLLTECRRLQRPLRVLSPRELMETLPDE